MGKRLISRIDERQAHATIDLRAAVVEMNQSQTGVYANKRLNQGKKTTQEVVPKKGNTRAFAKRVISMRFLH